MHTLVDNSSFYDNKAADIPQTPRGRALYTIDYFLNGRPVLDNHDHPRLTLLNGIPCC